MNNYQIINSVARSVDILKCLSNGINRLTDISNRLQINKAATHRILKTLEIKQIVVQEPVSRRYFLGPVIQTIASNPLAVHKILIESSIQEMEILGKSCGETVVLQIIRGGQRVVLEKVAGNEMIRFYPESMEIAPVHTGAGGRVLLAGLEDAQLDKLLQRLNFEKMTSLTITDVDTLRAKIEQVRQQGYSISTGESVKDAIAIAVPITSYFYPATLIVVGPKLRLEQKKGIIVKKAIKAGTAISKRLADILKKV